MSPTDGHPPEIFNRNRRRALRERAGLSNGDRFLWSYIAEDLTDRLAMVTRSFASALLIGPIASHAAAIMSDRHCEVSFASLSASEAAVGGGDVVQEDRLPYPPESFDLVISAGTLDSVNDLPGALVQIRRILKPDGLFLGHMFGLGTLATLKSLMLAAEGETASSHIHPQIDLRSAADLLTRAGFALPVADQDLMRVQYADWRKIVADIRNLGLGNALAGRRPYLGKDAVSRLDQQWHHLAGGAATIEENFVHISLSGWAPSPSQPQPAKRGSAQVSLASILSQQSNS